MTDNGHHAVVVKAVMDRRCHITPVFMIVVLTSLSCAVHQGKHDTTYVGPYVMTPLQRTPSPAANPLDVMTDDTPPTREAQQRKLAPAQNSLHVEPVQPLKKKKSMWRRMVATAIGVARGLSFGFGLFGDW
jgi:hypothetical protein